MDGVKGHGEASTVVFALASCVGCRRVEAADAHRGVVYHELLKITDEDEHVALCLLVECLPSLLQVDDLTSLSLHELLGGSSQLELSGVRFSSSRLIEQGVLQVGSSLGGAASSSEACSLVGRIRVTRVVLRGLVRHDLQLLREFIAQLRVRDRSALAYDASRWLLLVLDILLHL